MSLIYNEIPIPTNKDNASTWETYHVNLKKKYGKLNANTIFLMTWSVNANESITDNPSFISYFKKNNIDLSSLYDKYKANIETIGTDFLEMTGNTAKVLKFLLPVTGFLLLGYASFWVLKNIKKNVSKAIETGKVINDMPTEEKVKLISKIA